MNKINYALKDIYRSVLVSKLSLVCIKQDFLFPTGYEISIVDNKIFDILKEYNIRNILPAISISEIKKYIFRKYILFGDKVTRVNFNDF
jgi:hypothetical protein